MQIKETFRLAAAALTAALAAGCARTPSPTRMEWPVMGTAAAISFRGGDDDRYEVREAVAGVYDRLNSKLRGTPASRTTVSQIFYVESKFS